MNDIIINANRDLSKSGTLTTDKESLVRLSLSLDNKSKIEAYEYFTQNSERFETEFREEFVEIFSINEELLPEVDESEFWSEILFNLINSKNIQKVKSFIKGINAENWKLEPRKEEPETDFEIYPLESENEDCETTLEFASKIGASDIHDYLKSVLDKIKATYIQSYKDKFE